MEPRQEAPRRMSTKRLDRLSDVIIDTLKTLSSEQQKLTPGSLSEALRGREDFWRLLDANGKTHHNSRHQPRPRCRPRRQPSWPQRKPMPAMGTSMAEASPSSPDEVTGLSEFYRKSVLTLIALAQENENRNLSDSLDHLRLLILGNSLDLGALNDSLQQIKNVILKEAPDSATTAGTRSPWRLILLELLATAVKAAQRRCPFRGSPPLRAASAKYFPGNHGRASVRFG